MAKDPAVLFYTNDFLAGTYTMTDEQVGKYIRLLCLQHQKYTLTKEDMKNICKTYDKCIYDKFVQNDGLFYNQRMRDEALRRTKYSESRRNNRLKDMNNISESYDKHMETATETITENINRTPKLEEVIKFFESNDYPKEEAEKFWSYYDSLGWENNRGGVIKNWQSKVIGWMNNSKQFKDRDGKSKQGTGATDEQLHAIIERREQRKEGSK